MNTFYENLRGMGSYKKISTGRKNRHLLDAQRPIKKAKAVLIKIVI